MRSVDIEVPIELEGFVADAQVSYQLPDRVNRVKCLEYMNGYVRISGERVYLEGNFDVSDLAALIYFIDEGE